MTARLIALVMLPVSVMCVLGGSAVLNRRSAASRALSVDHGVAGLNQLVALRDSLHRQQTVKAFDVRFGELGATPSTAATFLGIDLALQVGPDRALSTRMIGLLGVHSPLSLTELQSLYAVVDGRIAPGDAERRFGDAISVVEDAVSRSLDQLETKARNAPLDAALETLRAAVGLPDVATPQGIALSAVWYPSPGSKPQAAAAALDQLREERSDYATTTARIRNLGDQRVIAALARITNDPAVTPFDQAVTDTLAGHPPAGPGVTTDGAKVASAFRGYLARDVTLANLVAAATTTVSAEARQLADSERSGFVVWTLITATLALASIAVALRLAHSIAEPLKDLAAYAHEINEGRLDTEPSATPDRGPRETRLAVSVFYELVANLKLLDAKANALAQCDFDDPVLSKALPGTLGRSLESSVAVLSGSIVERDQLQTHLAYQATHDSLTGISNRSAAISALEAAMQRGVRTGAATAVLFVDLNEFKAVNDSHGHDVGDEVLRQIAGRMAADLRAGDFVARLGGDEFVVVAEGVAGAAVATEIAERIIDAVSAPIQVGALRIQLGASIGIALSLDGPEEPLHLLARADAAMYRAKQHNRSAIEIFDADLQRQMVERHDIETDLVRAMADPSGGGLRLLYQPVVDAASAAVVGVEALIRWDRAGHGLLSPDSFIPIAEATSLIVDLDCWVLAEVSRQLAAWSTVPDLASLPVAVNISGRHLLSRQLASHIRAVLEDSGVGPQRLSIEITETVLLTDLVVAAAELDAVRALGVKVAIDDFGTGYTSLAHLQQLPVDTIKIDRSFISQLDARRGRSLVRMVTDLGHAIEVTIVAEGVETGDELAALQAMGADHLQGFLLSRPLTAAALSHWVGLRGEEPNQGAAVAAV